MVHTFLLNLDRNTERLVRMRREADRVGLSLERISGVLGNDVPERFRSQFIGTSLLPGEIGCYASHLMAAERLLERQLPYALVLEDDIEFEDDARSAIGELVAKLPTGWHLVKLCNRRPAQAVLCLDHLQSGRILVRYTRFPILAGAYLISAAGASRLLVSRQRTIPIDIEFHWPWRLGLDAYGVAPAIFPQRRLLMGSNIGNPDERPVHKLSRWESYRSLIYQLMTIGPVNLLACTLANLRHRAALKRQYGPKRQWPQPRPGGPVVLPRPQLAALLPRLRQTWCAL
jgi:glycosyl transferase family 25